MTKAYKYRVEYLESTGTQYIDTGIAGTSDLCVDFMVSTKTSPNQSCCGVIQQISSGYFRHHYSPDKSNAGYWIQMDASNNSSLLVEWRQDKKYHFVIDPTTGNATINNTKYTFTPLTPGIDSGLNYYIFGRDSFNGVIQKFPARFYFFKFIRNGKIIGDFIPVLDWDMKPCMYDKVSGELFYNKDTSGDDFIAGRQIHPVEYLESTGTQYIDTGIRLTQNNAIEVCYKINSISGFSGILGARTTASSNNISVNANVGGVNSPFISVDFNNSNFETYRARYDATTSDKILVYLDKHIRKISINNSVVVSNNTECNDAIETQSNCLLFRAPGISGYCDLNVYYCKIWDGDTLVRDFIPVIDNSGRPAMYDQVSGQLFYNQGTGEFNFGLYKLRSSNKKQLRKKLALMLANLKKKRKYYVELEYLESTGTQWIDTGYIPTNSTGYKLKHTICEDNGRDNIIIGCREDSGATRFWEDVDWGSSDTLGWGYGTYSNNGLIYRWSLVGKAGNVVESGCNYYNSRKCFVNDEIKQLPQPELPEITRPMYLFCANNVGRAGYFIKSKIYYLKITEGSELVRYFIPVLDWDMTPCMYDKVSGELFYNKGTGDFIPGRQIHPVEYLESTGKQYIDTGIVPTSSMNAKIDFYIPSTTPNTEQHILGAMAGTNAKNGGRYQFLGLLKDSGNRWRTAYGKLTTNDNNWGTAIYDEKVHFDTTLQNGISTVYINNSTTPDWTLTFEKDVTTPSSIYIFATNIGGKAGVLSTCRVYSCSISHNGTLLGDFIPMVDENGVGAMFDRVTHTIYDNAGTGEGFKYPPVELEYLESTGTQYIDTGIIGTNANMGIDVTWAFSNNNTNMCIFSSRSAQTSNTLTLFWIKTGSNRMRFDGVGQQYFTDSVNASVSDEIFNFNYKSKTGAVATLTNKTTEHIQTLNIGKLETFSTNPLYLFCSRDSAYVYSWIKMYGCKIYDGDVVIRDYIPVFYNGKSGMWDKVNEVFYPNLGKDSFSVSRIVEPEYE